MTQLELRRRIAIYASVMAFLIAGVYNLIRAGLEFQWEQSLTVLGFAFFLFNFPLILVEINTIKTRLKLLTDEYVLTFILLLLACLLGWMKIEAGSFFTSLGLLSFIRNVIAYAKGFNRYEPISLGFVLVISVWICIKVWDGHYIHPMLLELMPFDNKGHIDTWFHVSITQMIKTYHIPSTGLNGIPFMPYHFGSHLIFACLSTTLDIHAFTFYQLAFPVIFIPLFVKAVLGLPVTWAESHNHEYKIGVWFWLVLTFGIIGVFPNALLTKAASNWNSFAISESYCVSLIFFFFTLHLIAGHFYQHKESRVFKIVISVFVLIMIVIIGLLKISTLFMFDVAFLYLVLRLKLYYRKSIMAVLVLATLLSFGCLSITMDPNSVSTFELFHFFKNYVGVNMLTFIPVYFTWSIVLILALVLILKFEDLPDEKLFPRVLLETVLVFCIVGLIPGIVLSIDGGSAGFFMDIHFWFSISFILVILPRFISLIRVLFGSFKKKQVILIVWVAIVMLCSFVVLRNFRYAAKKFIRSTYAIYSWTAGKHLGEESFAGKIGFSDFFRDRKHLLFQMDSNLQVSPAYKTLTKLYLADTLSLKEKSRTTLLLRDDSQLYQEYPCNIYPFMIPALTGMARKDGYIYENCVDKNYSFEYYSRKNLQKKKHQPSGITKESEIKITDENVTLNPL